jgi:hypothetical protein
MADADCRTVAEIQTAIRFGHRWVDLRSGMV